MCNKSKSILNKMLNWTRSYDLIEKIQIKSVTDSLFKVGLLIVVVGCGTASLGYAPQLVSFLVIGLGILFLLVGLGLFIYFALTKPEYLRSEVHQQRMRAMEILGDKENVNNPNIYHLPAITNPYANPELDKGEIKSTEA